MKQLLLILSFIVAAFLAACSEGKTNLRGRTNVGFNKTIEQLDKASTVTSLEALKVQLEINENVQVPDVIALVRGKFGSSTVKPQPQTDNDDDKDNKDNRRIMQEKVRQQAEATIAKEILLERAESLSLKLEDDCDLKSIEKSTEGDTEIRSFYVKTCDIKVLVKRKLDKAGKVTAVKAFVGARISKEGLEHLDSKDGEKTLESIIANYSASTGSMILKFKIKSKKKNLDLESLPFAYTNGEKVSGEFKDSKGIYNGKFESTILEDKKAIILEFSSGDVVSTHLSEDLGLFGKTSAKSSDDATEDVEPGLDAPETEEQAKAQAEAEVDAEEVKEEDKDKKSSKIVKEEVKVAPAKLRPESGVKSPTNPKGKKRYVPNPNSRY